MADTASKHIDMTTGSLWRNIPLFAFPVAATSILEQLSNLIATVIIGNFSGDQGTLAMAAVGSNVPLTSLMLNLFIGMSLGSNVVIANAIGRNDQNMVNRAVHNTLSQRKCGLYRKRKISRKIYEHNRKKRCESLESRSEKERNISLNVPFRLQKNQNSCTQIKG